MPEMLHPFVFDPLSGAWLEDRAAPLERAPARLTLVTWNVWFAPYGFEARFLGLLEVVRARRPDIVCLQEIIPESLAMLLAAPWIRDHYRVSDARGTTLGSYGVVLLSRLPVRSLALHDLPSNMGRRLLLAEIAVGPRRLAVGTVHLESLKPNRELRAEQLGEIFPRLKAASPDCMLAGDFNLCSSWTRENQGLDPTFADLWPTLRGIEPGYTEDTDVNATLRNVKGGKEKQVRFDRILLRSAKAAFRPVSIELLGTEPVAPESPELFPSDHFGLAAVLEVGAPVPPG